MSEKEPKYRVKEVFFALQGEGRHTGRPCVFLRFAGCNSWSGKEEERNAARGLCGAICDTDFNGGVVMTLMQLVAQVEAAWLAATGGSERSFVVLTGGEPMMQANGALSDALHALRWKVHVETNGSYPIFGEHGFDWVAVSPKPPMKLRLNQCDELKVLWPLYNPLDFPYDRIYSSHRYVMPVDYSFSKSSGISSETVFKTALEFIKKHPEWALGGQAHKLWGIR